MKKNLLVSVFLMFLCTAVSSCAAPREAVYTPNSSADLVLELVPIHVYSVDLGSSADAIENIPEQLDKITAIVLFRIDKIVEGELVREKNNAGIKEFSELAKNILTLKVKKVLNGSEDDFAEKTFKIGVQDPLATFGISDWKEPQPNGFRVYLKKYKDWKQTYVMLRHKRIG